MTTALRDKTILMLELEQQWGKDIKLLLAQGTVRHVGGLLGISYSTVSKWRVKLGIG